MTPDVTRTDESVCVLPWTVACRLCDRHWPAGTPITQDYLGFRCLTCGGSA